MFSKLLCFYNGFVSNRHPQVINSTTTGLLYDRFGHRITSIVASVLVGGGYLLSYLSVKEIWWNSPFWVLVIFYIFIGQGSYGINISALDVNIKNFSKQDRGKVFGLSVPF